MNVEAISQISFVARFPVEATQTARHFYAGLPFGCSYADRLADVLCSGHLLAQLESTCIDAMQDNIDWDSEIVFGVAMDIVHCGPAYVGELVQAHGFVTRVGRRSVQFNLDARVGERAVASGQVRFAVVDRIGARRRAAACRPVPAPKALELSLPALA